MGKSLTVKRKRFVSEYLVDLNATQAAIRAGYSQKTANVHGSFLLTLPDIQNALQSKLQKKTDKLELSAEKVLEELCRIAFSDIRKSIEWSNSSVSLTPSSELDSDTAATISEVSQTPNGIKIKLHDKLSALGLLSKYFGLTPELMKLSGTVGLKRVADDYTDEELIAIIESKRSERDGSSQ